MKKLQLTVISALFALLPIASSAAGNAAEGKNKSTTCHACHGATGDATQGIYPDLAGQHQNYLSKALHDYRDGRRNNPIMSGFAANLTDEDIEDISAWYASQEGLVEIIDK
jgi:cytochrome c553